MDSEIQEIITRFKQLDTSSQRSAYLQIVDQLSPYAWRDLKNYINKRSFDKDILGCLPVEIAVQVVQYLNVGEVHSLRRVSRRWCELLSSDMVCSLQFRLCAGESFSLARLGGDIKSTLFRYWQRRVRLEQGNPVQGSEVEFDLNDHYSGLKLHYSNGRVALSSSEHNTTIQVLDLCSSGDRFFCTENRESFSHVRITENLVMGVTRRGYLHAWDIGTEEKAYTIRLPNTNILQFVASGTKVALSFKASVKEEQQIATIMHCDLKTQKSHTLEDISEPILMSLGSSYIGLTIVCIDRHGYMSPIDRLRYRPNLHISKYVLHRDGDASVAHSYSMELPLPKTGGLWEVRPHYEIQETFGFIDIGILVADCHSERDSSERVSPERRTKFMMPVTYYQQPEGTCVHKLPKTVLARPYAMANVDNGVLYWMRDDGERSIWISNLLADPALYPARSMSPHPPRVSLPGRPMDDGSHSILAGDSRFVSLLNEDFMRVWSFNGVEQISNFHKSI